MITNTVLAYGSLRPNEYNFYRFLNMGGLIKGIAHLNIKVNGYTLYTDNGHYPFAVPCSNRKIICDAIDFTPAGIEALIAMELQAGYCMTLTHCCLMFIKVNKNKRSKFVGSNWIDSRRNISKEVKK